jgi:L-arabinokinase
MPNIAIYASAHGYGHTARCQEVAHQIVKLNSQAVVFLMTKVVDTFFLGDEHARIRRRRVKMDAGLHQVDGVTMDLPGTLNDLKQLEISSDDLIDAEVEFLRREKINVVLCDLPHLAFEAAAAAGIPAYGLSNFSWDWIYQAYVREYPTFLPHIERIRKSYRSVTRLFRLPFGNPMRVFRDVQNIPLVARTSKLDKEAARKKMKLGKSESMILFSFGGFGLDIELKRSLSKDVLMLATDPSPDPGPPFTHMPDEKLGELGLHYPDLVRAADVVISKPGYGIVSECIANRTPLLYTPRGEFREYPVLVREMKKHLPSRLITLKTLAAGNWLNAFHDLKSQPFPPALPCDGARVVAEKLLEVKS